MKNLFLCFFVLFLGTLWAQQNFDFFQDNTEKNFYQIQEQFQAHITNIRAKKAGIKSKSTGAKIPGFKQFKRWEWFMETRVYPSGEMFNTIARSWWEFHKYLEEETLVETEHFGGNWQSIGPSRYQLGGSGYNGGLGRVNCIAFDPKDSNIVYAGTPSAGLWKYNAGSWTCLTDGLPLIGVSGIAISPKNAQVIYILTGDGDGSSTNSIGILKTTDGGATWKDTGLMWGVKQFVKGYKLIMHPSNPKILMAVTTFGLFKTADAGTNWKQTLFGSFRDIEIHPTTPQIVYAATSNKVYRSVDTGDNWQQVDASQFASGITRIALGVSKASPDVVYALLAGSKGLLGLYRSTDQGQTFVQRSNSPNTLGYSETGNDTASQAWYDLALIVAPDNADLVHTGGVNTWKSEDGGASWKITSYWVETSKSHGYTHADIHALEYNHGTLYCGSDGGIFRSSDRGKSWQDLSAGLQIMQIYKIAQTPQDKNLIYAGAQDNGSNRITGTLSTHVFGADGGTCAIDHNNSNNVYIATQNGGMYKSVNAGESFRSVKPSGSTSGAWVTPYFIHPKNSQTLYAGYTNVWKSTNGADTWNNISQGKIGSGTCRTMAISSNYIYVGKTKSLFVTTNDGQNWQNISAHLPTGMVQISAIAVSSKNPKHLWASFSGYSEENKVYQSVNAGASWKNISHGLPNLPTHTLAYEKGNLDGVYIGMDVGVYYRNNNLSTWVPFMQSLPNIIVKDLKIHKGAAKIRAATYGRGIWESDLFTSTNTNVKRLGANKVVHSSYCGSLDKLK